MSLSENDRKTLSETRKRFPPVPSIGPLAMAIAAALKAEFANTPSAHKTVAQLTQSNERAVRNWFECKNSPSGENLIILMRHSDLVLRTMLGLAERQDLVVVVGLAGLRRQLTDTIAAIDALPQTIE